MQFIGKTKTQQKRSKLTVPYPLIRLPREFAEIIGMPAAIYQTRCQDRTAFVVLPGEKEGDLPEEKVGQLGNNQELETRLFDLKKGSEN